MKQKDDIMVKSARRNMERPGNATPCINTGQLYLQEIVSWLYLPP